MPTELDQKLEQTIEAFTHRAEMARSAADRDLYIHLGIMAVGIQENRRLLDHLRSRIEEIGHELGAH